MSADDVFERQRRAARRALDAFQRVLAEELGGNDETWLTGLARTTHQHTTIVLFGAAPVWKKKAIAISATVHFGEVITATEAALGPKPRSKEES